MSQETRRVRVPTNGHGPHTVGDPEEPGPPPAWPGSSATPPFSPTQLAVGFGIIASLVVLILGRRRNRPKSS